MDELYHTVCTPVSTHDCSWTVQTTVHDGIHLFVRNHDIHHYKTRNNNDLVLEKPVTCNFECTKRAFFYKRAKFFNNS